MALVTYTLTATLSLQNGDPLSGVVVKAELDRIDYDNGIVTPEPIEATTDVNGVITMDLWPNTRGTTGSVYIIQAKSPNGLKTYMKVGARMPESNSDLHDIITDLP